MNRPTIKLLLIEDNASDAERIRRFLAHRPDVHYLVEAADSLADGLERMSRGDFQIILLDLHLPDSGGLETLDQITGTAPTMPVLVLTGLDDCNVGIEAVRRGAQDYLVKEKINAEGLDRAVRHSLERCRAGEELRKLQQEVRGARKIQQGLLAKSLPQLKSFEIGGSSYPTELAGGDYFDMISLKDDSIKIMLGDVSGHGYGAALLMATARAYLRALSRMPMPIDELLTLANQLLTEDMVEDLYLTLFVGQLDLAMPSLVYCSAGHCTGFILDRHGQLRHKLESTDLPLGVYADSTFSSSEPIPLHPGEMILLLTDGVLEALAPDDTRFGTERALAIARLYRDSPSQQIVYNLYHAVRAFAQNGPQLDDISALVIKVREL